MRCRAGTGVMILVAMLATRAQFANAFETWTEQRDRGVERQSLDYSCGLAALATLMSLGNPVRVTERDLLVQLADLRAAPDWRVIEDRGVSFADLARLAALHGREALGLAVETRALQALKGAAIVALDLGGQAHFSVLKAVYPEGGVWLADPSWGNRRLGAWEFEALFAPNGGRGRVLLVSPPDGARPMGEQRERAAKKGLSMHGEAGAEPRALPQTATRWSARIAPTL